MSDETSDKPSIDELKNAVVCKIFNLLEAQDRISSRIRSISADIRYSVLPDISRELLCIQVEAIGFAASKLIDIQVEQFKTTGVPGLIINDSDIVFAMKTEEELATADLPEQDFIFPIEAEPQPTQDKPKQKRISKKRPVAKKKLKRSKRKASHG